MTESDNNVSSNQIPSELDLDWGYIRWLERHRDSAVEMLHTPGLIPTKQREAERRCRVYTKALQAEVTEQTLRRQIGRVMEIMAAELARGQIRPSLYQEVLKATQQKED